MWRALVLLFGSLGCVFPSGGPKEGIAAAALNPPVPAGQGRGDIAGAVLEERPAARLPVAFETVGLYRRGELIMQASTDLRGHFQFPGLYPWGRYEVRLLSDRYEGSVPVLFTGRPRRDVELRAESR